MRGRKPTPTNLKILHGNPGHRKLNTTEPKPRKGIPDCPTSLNKKGQATYSKLAAQLNAMGVLTAADGAALELLAGVLEEYRAARDVIQNKGQTYSCRTKSNGYMTRTRPEVRIAADAMRRAMQILTEFGLTPAARTKVAAAVENDDDAQNRFFN